MRLDHGIEDQKLSLDITPLIDIVFLLVMFFAVSSSFISGEDLNRLKTSLFDLGQSNTQLEQQLIEKTKENLTTKQSLDNKINDLGYQLTLSQHQVAALGLQIAELKSEAEQREERERLLRQLLAERRTESVMLENQRTELSSKNADMVAKLALLQSLLDDRESELSNALKDQKDLESRMKLTSTQIEQFTETLAARELEIDSVQQKLLDTSASELLLQQLIAKKVAELEGIQRQLSANESLLFESNQQLRTAEKDRQKSFSEMQALQSKVLTLELELDKFRDIADADRELIRRAIIAQRQLSEGMVDHLANNSLNISRDQQKLTLQLSDKILFPSGSTRLKPEGLEVLRELGQLLAGKSKEMDVQIGGHTDNVPVSEKSGPLSDNWGLSAARSVNVVRFFEQELGITPERMAAVGYGQHQPIADNTAERGRALNRRIEIVLIPR